MNAERSDAYGVGQMRHKGAHGWRNGEKSASGEGREQPQLRNKAGGTRATNNKARVKLHLESKLGRVTTRAPKRPDSYLISKA